MARTLTLFLTTSPYTSENTHMATGLAEAALEKGYNVNLFASEDGVYNFTTGHKATGIPNPETRFKGLLEMGLRVEL